VVDRNARDRLEVISFKVRASRKRLAEAVQERRGHPDLSHAMREALDEYIERYLPHTRPASDASPLAEAA
jgi:hypothetical protein